LAEIEPIESKLLDMIANFQNLKTFTLIDEFNENGMYMMKNPETKFLFRLKHL
jgi:hypothetical protein